MHIGPAILQAISNFRELTETTDRPFPRSRKLPIGSFRNDRPFPNIYGKECVLTLNSIIFPSYTLFLEIFGFKKNGIEY